MKPVCAFDDNDFKSHKEKTVKCVFPMYFKSFVFVSVSVCVWDITKNNNKQNVC